MNRNDFPQGKTAILIIHGIGEQNPFETLDSFSQGIVRNAGVPLKDLLVTHEIAKRKSKSGSEWNESFVRISSGGNSGYIDVHEYYWAYMTEEKITLQEILLWIKKAIRGAMDFAEENDKLDTALSEESSKEQQYVQAIGGRQKKKKHYWWRLTNLFRFLRYIYPIALVLSAVITSLAKRFPAFLLNLFPGLGSIINKAIGWAASRGSIIIRDYVGDVAIYTSMDEKSKFHQFRRGILGESNAFLKELLRSTEYDQVIVAGHSLGSVIAYDTLNQIDVEQNVPKAERLPVQKIRGLITFGSPLDKIAFFFRDHVKGNESLRRQLLGQLHLFKARWVELSEKISRRPDDIKLGSHFASTLGHVVWINYYNDKDPVSGHLDYYDIQDSNNIKLQFGDGTKHSKHWGEAHLAYWSEPKMFRDIIASLLPLRAGLKREALESKEKMIWVL